MTAPRQPMTRPRTPQDGPKTPPRRPKTAPRRPKTPPRRPRTPPGPPRKPILGPLGADLQSIWGHFGLDGGPIRGRCGVALGAGLGYDLGSMLGQFGRPSRPFPLLSSTRKDLHGGGGVARPAGVLDPPPPWFTTGAGRVKIYRQPCQSSLSNLPKRSPGGPGGPHRRPPRRAHAARLDHSRPLDPPISLEMGGQIRPRTAPDAPKTAQEPPKRAPDAPKRPQDAPKRPQDASKRSQDASWAVMGAILGPIWARNWAPDLPKIICFL